MSGDDLPPAEWGAGVDPDAMSDLRLRKGREALEQGDAGLALVEAEELLDINPSHEEALWLAAEAAFELGAGATAIGALEPLLTLQPLSAEAWSLLARCRLDGMELDAAAQAARRSIELVPERAHDEAQAWFVLGIIGRQRGLLDFRSSLEQAAARDPGCYSLRPPDDPRSWKRALAQALKRLPLPLRPIYAAMKIELLDHPRNEDLSLMGEPLSPLVPAQMLPPEPPYGLPPAAIALYTANLRPQSPGPEGQIEALWGAMMDLSELWLPPEPELDDLSEE